MALRHHRTAKEIMEGLDSGVIRNDERSDAEDIIKATNKARAKFNRMKKSKKPLYHKLSKEQLYDMPLRELEMLPWKGMPVNEPIGLKDVFTKEQIQWLYDHPDYKKFSRGFQDDIFNALD